MTKGLQRIWYNGDMLIIRLAGGLGNQMQQYAMYRKLLKLGRDARLDFAWFDADTQKEQLSPRKAELLYFPGLFYEACTDAERERFLKRGIVERGISRLLPSRSRVWEEREMYHPELFTIEDKYLMGYFLCNKYYEDLWEELRRAFTFPMHAEERYHLRNVDMMNEMLERESVSVHIRRGDYLIPENEELFGGITTDAYYATAMDYFRKKLPHAHFYIFTNDVPYALERYADETQYTIIDWNTGRNSLLDMQLMSCCRGNICANSTFSFWGARLNARSDREVIRPYRMRNNQTYDPEKMHDYWKGWVLMDESGSVV